MKRYVCLLACLLLMVMYVPVSAVPQDDGYNHLAVSMDYVVDTSEQMLIVGLKDENGGAVNGYVYFEVDGEQFGNGANADTSDRRVVGAAAKLSYASIPSTATTVEVVSKSYSWGVTLFEEARKDITAEVFAALGYEVTTTTQTTQTTETVQSDPTEAVVVTEATTPTTGVPQNNREQLKIDVDALLAQHFGYSEAEMEERIKAYVNREDYAYYVGDSAATLHLEISYDEAYSADTSHFINAKNADERYASYSDEEVNGMAFKMALVFTSESGVVEYLDMVAIKYDIEMVIPSSMQKSKELAFASVEEGGQLSELKAAYPNNGAIVLTLQSFQSFAVMSFGTQTEKVLVKPSLMDAVFNVFNTWQTALLFVGGVILFIGGIVLIVVVSLRKRHDAVELDEQFGEVSVLSEEDCKPPVPSRKSNPESVAQPQTEKRTLDEALPVIHRVENMDSMDPEEFGRLSEQSVTPAKTSARSTSKNTANHNRKDQQSPSVDELLDELTEDIETLTNH